jgi:hypothetical protein
MEETENRDSTTWGVTLLEKAKQGLQLQGSVNDGGTGLNKGVKEAFPDVIIQADVFHAEKDISFAVLALERKAYKDINLEYIAARKLLVAKHTKDKLLERYSEIVEKSRISIDIYDNTKILYTWLIEVFAIGGDGYEVKKNLLHFIADELEKIPSSNAYLKKGVGFLSKKTNTLLQFVKKAEELMCNFSKEENVDIDVLQKMWEQCKYPNYSSKYNVLEGQIGLVLGSHYTEIHEKWNQMLKQIVRASSMVECINSLIRPYLFLKRVVTGKFLDLLQFYFNTRKYKRSRVSERREKSPIELLTGASYENPLDILGY